MISNRSERTSEAFDAALAQGRLEGVKAGLEAAAKEAEDFWGVDIAAPRIRALNSTTIVNQIGEK